MTAAITTLSKENPEQVVDMISAKLTKENINRVIDTINSNAALKIKIAEYINSVNERMGGKLTSTGASLIKARLVMDVALSVF